MKRKQVLLILLTLLLAGLACTSQQQGAVETLVAERFAPVQGESITMSVTATPEFSAVVIPTLAPTMAGPMGTLTAIAPMIIPPTLDPRPYIIENRGKPHFVEFFAFW